MRFTIGARVHYRAYPSGLPVTDVAGTVVDIGRHATKARRLLYVVQWDGIDYARYSPTNYEASDLARIACDACGADAGEPCRPYCIGGA
jgi:hypothetical protein